MLDLHLPKQLKESFLEEQHGHFKRSAGEEEHGNAAWSAGEVEEAETKNGGYTVYRNSEEEILHKRDASRESGESIG